MNRAKTILFFSLLTLACASSGCGDDNGGGGGITFTLDPPGPTVVQKGQTLQFNTVPPGLAVLWAVEGGASNGTIDASSGLYTPPSTLPLEPRVTVTATLDAFSASAQVDLRTGNTVAFGPEEPIHDNKALGIPGFGTGVHDLMAVRNGSLQVDAAWTSEFLTGSAILFSQALDLAPFAPERNLTNDPGTDQTVLSLDTSPTFNPGMIIQISSLNLYFLGSPDGGASFSEPVPIDLSGNNQDFGALRFDAQGGIHVSLVENFSQIRYSRSTDGGAHWSNPPTILTDDVEARCSTNIAVTPDGNTIHLCYAEGTCGSGTDSGEGDIIIATSTDGGVSFPTKATVPGTDAAANCRIALGLNGEVYVSYKKGEEVFLTKSSDGGVSFPTGRKVDTTPIGDAFPLPYMAVDSLGRIDLVWGADLDNDDTTESLRYSRSLDGGTSFSPDIEIASAGTGKDVRASGLVHDISGRLHLLFRTDRNDPDPASPLENDILYLRAE